MIKEEGKTVCEEKRFLEGFVYTYRLMLHSERKYSTIGVPLYSVSVDMCEIATERSTSARTGELFYDERKARKFFDKLVRNLATPIDLAYIVEDEFT